MDTPRQKELQQILGKDFRDPALLRLALTHRSFLHERPEEAAESNERLEFLGDALIGLVVGEALFRRFPHVSEGWLTEARSRLVRTETLAAIGGELRLGEFLLLGRGEEQSGGRGRPRNLARTFEAVVGAVYVDRGYRAARAFILRCFGRRITDAEGGALNFKSLLQELVQAAGHRPPEYRIVEEKGEGEARLFEVEARTEDGRTGRGRGRTKQAAEQRAAQAVYEGT